MEKYYSVYFGKIEVGKVQVTKQGLYYNFRCRCQLTGDITCRLLVRYGSNNENLGILVPIGTGFGLDTQRPVKRFGTEDNFVFDVLPRHDSISRQFAPIYPDEPFSYIEQLKSAYLIIKNGKAGILVK